MIIPTKKLQNGFEMPVYGLGTWKMGGKATYDPNTDDTVSISAIKHTIDSGVTHIDTAEGYADGYAEILIGKAIKEYDRSTLFLASKARVEHLGYDDLIHAAKDSIKRLGVSYLDLYYAHRYSLDIPIKETMRGMDTLVEEGLIRYIGVSNFTVAELEEAQSYAKHKIVANQLHLNLKYREAERKGLLTYCQKHDVMFVAWRPLQQGLLANAEDCVKQLAEKYHKTSAQIALNWLISQENIVTLSKTTSSKHLAENLGALGWQMDQKDIAFLATEYPHQENISDTVPLH